MYMDPLAIHPLADTDNLSMMKLFRKAANEKRKIYNNLLTMK